MTYKGLVAIVVDEIPTMRKIIRGMLKDLKFQEVFEVQNGSVALELLEINKVDLIISDWNMSTMNGLDLLQRVRSNKLLEEIPFLMAFDAPKKEEILQAIDAKVSNIIVKPFSPAVLAEKLAAIIPKR